MSCPKLHFRKLWMGGESINCLPHKRVLGKESKKVCTVPMSNRKRELIEGWIAEGFSWSGAK